MLNTKRFVAFWLDTYITTGVSLIPLLILGGFDIVFERFYLLMGVFSLLTLLKDVVFKNASIGKKLLRLEILKDNGSKPSTIEVVLRNLFFPLWMIDGILILCNNKKIGDIIFKTKVVNTK